MIASILIIAFSVVMFVYWFRYSCILLLRGAAEQADLSAAQDKRFSVLEVLESLKTAQELDPLQRSLDRDYHVLKYLIEHAADLELVSIEDRLLILDYKVMHCCFNLTRTLAPVHARKALTEMASVLVVLVRKMSQQSGVQIEA
jgi:hypothetical protein